MIAEFFQLLADWGPIDTWIAATAALAAAACTLPGNFLLLKRQSMMGDALSHTVLLGLVVAFLANHWMYQAGWYSEQSYHTWRQAAMFAGAMVVGVLSALLTQLIERLGKVDAGAALGVVFTTLFALGLLLMRVAADQVHVDPDCVLYGTVETVVMDIYGDTGVPRAALVNGGVLLFNLLLVSVFFKELKISTFDPGLATALGIPAWLIHYAVLGVTAMTLVAAFDSVGSILVIAMLIVPPATASLLTDRLGRMIAISLCVAVVSAVLGHVLAITAPAMLFGRLGFSTVRDASTAGMMAVAAGGLFFLAALLAPRHGVLSRLVVRWQLALKITREDLLGLLYRLEEHAVATDRQARRLSGQRAAGIGPLWSRLAIFNLRHTGMLETDEHGYTLTPAGRQAARSLVRSHRLWESYMAKHFQVPEDHLHATASRVEHYIDSKVRDGLAQELEQPAVDPHGRDIPDEEIEKP